MIQREGVWWPDGDRICEKLLLAEVRGLDKAIEHCTRMDTAVQAGGNVGIYPAYLAKHYDHVWTFEPDPINQECLKLNTAHLNNVYRMPMGLGNFREKVGLKHHPENCGASHVVADGDIQLIPLDALNLVNIDLIQLDVEGFEHRALLGAKHTIERDRPVLMVENVGHGDRYGCRDLIGWISDTFNYKMVASPDHDVVMIPR